MRFDLLLIAGLLVGLLVICCNVLIVVGALRMLRFKNYGLAITACILAMITPPGLILGLPVGIWALIVLSRHDVREAFQANRSTSAARQPGAGQKPASGSSTPTNVSTQPSRTRGAWKVAAIVVAALLLVLAIPVGFVFLWRSRSIT